MCEFQTTGGRKRNEGGQMNPIERRGIESGTDSMK